MRLDEKQKTLIIDHLKKTWPDPQPCPVCRNEHWILTDIVYELREYHGGNLVVGGSLFPVVAVTCTKCGNSLFLNAITIGLLPPSKQAELKSGQGA
jgi:hypothetical protein